LKNLPTNVSDNYLKIGSRPRVFFEITGSTGGSVKKWATTSGMTGYDDRIFKNQAITEKIDAFGGMAVVSGTNVSILKAGEEIQFYSSTSLFPKAQASEVGAGVLVGEDALIYLTVRN